MTRRLESLATLSRWRQLQETQAADAHRASRDAIRRCDADAEVLRDIAQGVQSHRAAMVDGDAIDLDRLELLRDIENLAWRDVATAETARTIARESEANARVRHLQARTAVRVADDARAIASVEHALRVETAIFDQLADLVIRRAP